MTPFQEGACLVLWSGVERCLEALVASYTYMSPSCFGNDHKNKRADFCWYISLTTRSHRLTVRTPGFHPGNRSSILREITKVKTSPRVAFLLWFVFMKSELRRSANAVILFDLTECSWWLNKKRSGLLCHLASFSVRLSKILPPAHLIQNWNARHA